MLLNTLRNDQIYPFLWRRRRGQALEVDVFDLSRFQSVIDVLDSGLSELERDLQVERLLYGSEAQPRYSGWTPSRLAKCLEECGFEAPSIEALSEPGEVRVRTTPRPGFSPLKNLELRRERLNQRIWSGRKWIRHKSGELSARARQFIRPVVLEERQPLWLNLGAGAEDYPDYLKVDLGGEQHLYDSIVTLRKIPDASVEKIYCNHVLEHLPPRWIEPTLKRWLEILMPGGKVVARMPDAEQSARHLNAPWVETSEQVLAQWGFPNFLAREQKRSGTLDDQACIQAIYGWSASTPHSWDPVNQHKSLWTPALARERFTRAGFQVERCGNLGTLNTAVLAYKR